LFPQSISQKKLVDREPKISAVLLDGNQFAAAQSSHEAAIKLLIKN